MITKSAHQSVSKGITLLSYVSFNKHVKNNNLETWVLPIFFASTRLTYNILSTSASTPWDKGTKMIKI